MTTDQIEKKIISLHKKRDKIFERDIKPIEREIEKLKNQKRSNHELNN